MNILDAIKSGAHDIAIASILIVLCAAFLAKLIQGEP